MPVGHLRPGWVYGTQAGDLRVASPRETRHRVAESSSLLPIPRFASVYDLRYGTTRTG